MEKLADTNATTDHMTLELRVVSVHWSLQKRCCYVGSAYFP